MTVRSAAFNVSGTAAEIIAKGRGTKPGDRVQVTISNCSAIIYIGGSDVSAANGTAIAATTGERTLELGPTDTLYALASGISATCRVLTNRVGYVADT